MTLSKTEIKNLKSEADQMHLMLNYADWLRDYQLIGSKYQNQKPLTKDDINLLQNDGAGDMLGKVWDNLDTEYQDNLKFLNQHIQALLTKIPNKLAQDFAAALQTFLKFTSDPQQKYDQHLDYSTGNLAKLNAALKQLKIPYQNAQNIQKLV